MQIRRGAIHFDHIYFSYGKGTPMISDLQLDIAAGEKISLVRPLGGRKSTLVNLLFRLFNINDGLILIDNQDIFAVSQESLHAQIGMINPG